MDSDTKRLKILGICILHGDIPGDGEDMDVMPLHGKVFGELDHAPCPDTAEGGELEGYDENGIFHNSVPYGPSIR